MNWIGNHSQVDEVSLLEAAGFNHLLSANDLALFASSEQVFDMQYNHGRRRGGPYPHGFWKYQQKKLFS